MHTIQFSDLISERSFLWAMQNLLGCVLVYAGVSRTLMHSQATAEGKEKFVFDCDDLPCWLASFIALLEIVGGLCLLVPAGFWTRDLWVQVVAGVMASLMAYTAYYHMRRKGPAAPVIAVFLMAIFVIIGYWR
jgi:uncharacterized membrane protein YphA (DoxX/SURF4 family)